MTDYSDIEKLKGMRLVFAYRFRRDQYYKTKEQRWKEEMEKAQRRMKELGLWMENE